MCQVLHHDLDFRLGLLVHLEVALRHQPIPLRLPVLAHHHHGARIGRLEAQHQVEENEGEGSHALRKPGCLCSITTSHTLNAIHEKSSVVCTMMNGQLPTVAATRSATRWPRVMRCC